MELFDTIKSIHRGLAYSTIILLGAYIMLIIKTMFTYSGVISTTLRKVSFFTMILLHLQVLIGIIFLFVASSGFKNALSSGTLMNDEYHRLTYVEHPVAMLITTTLMTIINSYLKKSNELKLQYSIMSFAAALLFQYALPWSKLFSEYL